MSRKSDLTGKGPLYGNRRSHAMNANRRRWNLNLQKVSIVDPITKKKIKVKISAKELKTLKKSQ